MIENLYPTVTLLGSTGSIGKQALELAAAKGIKIKAIGANRSVGAVEKQARQFCPAFCAMADEAAAKDLKSRLADTDIKVLSGEEGLLELIDLGGETVINSVIGSAGLKPTLKTLKSGKKLALANKESLVMAGDIVMREAAENNAEIRPIDSEHSAIWQSLRAGNKSEIKKLILTASGGPFFSKTAEELKKMTVADALKHPTWNMGAAITIDSATLMNKGFEVIEASHLFSVKPENIEVLVHRESIIHSMVEYIDNSVIAQMSIPDMRMCINYALTYPERATGVTEELDLVKVGHLDFAKPDTETFPLLAEAYRVIKSGGALPAVLHAANEVAVGAFLSGELKRFTDIQETVMRVTVELDDFKNDKTLDGVFAADKAARARTLELITQSR